MRTFWVALCEIRQAVNHFGEENAILILKAVETNEVLRDFVKERKHFYLERGVQGRLCITVLMLEDTLKRAHELGLMNSADLDLPSSAAGSEPNKKRQKL